MEITYSTAPKFHVLCIIVENCKLTIEYFRSAEQKIQSNINSFLKKAFSFSNFPYERLKVAQHDVCLFNAC